MAWRRAEAEALGSAAVWVSKRKTLALHHLPLREVKSACATATLFASFLMLSVIGQPPKSNCWHASQVFHSLEEHDQRAIAGRAQSVTWHLGVLEEELEKSLTMSQTSASSNRGRWKESE